MQSALISSRIWKDIKGFKDIYRVSEFGDVLSVRKNRTMSQSKINSGYFRVCLSNKGRVTTYLAHRLVATAFIANIPDGMVVDHVDGDKTNNHLSNLEIVTPKENYKRSYERKGATVHVLPCRSKKGCYRVSRKVEGKYIYINGIKDVEDANTLAECSEIDFLKRFTPRQSKTGNKYIYVNKTSESFDVVIRLRGRKAYYKTCKHIDDAIKFRNKYLEEYNVK